MLADLQANIPKDYLKLVFMQICESECLLIHVLHPVFLDLAEQVDALHIAAFV